MWKNVNNIESSQLRKKEGTKNYRKLRNILTRNAEKAKKNTLTAYKVR
jgi:hypothetical protein